MMLPCTLTCILANSKGCAQWESYSFPRVGWRIEMFPLPLRTMVCIGVPSCHSVAFRSGSKKPVSATSSGCVQT